jgi:hypothetical protein
MDDWLAKSRQLTPSYISELHTKPSPPVRSNSDRNQAHTACLACNPTIPLLTPPSFFNLSNSLASTADLPKGHSTNTSFPAFKLGAMVAKCRSTRTEQTTRSIIGSLARSVHPQITSHQLLFCFFLFLSRDKLRLSHVLQVSREERAKDKPSGSPYAFTPSPKPYNFIAS